MICDKCNRVLPDDSEFCQYCGNKIETTSNEFTEEVESPVTPQSTFTPVVTKDTSALNIEGMTPEEALNKFLEIQAEETIKMMEANAQSQPHHAGDVDFGLVPEKPIYTLALMSVDGEKEYLNKLYTINGEKITWNRRGSISVDGINGMIDIYDTFLPSGQPYKTIYINMYGAKESNNPPVGFIMNDVQNKVYAKSKKVKNIKTKFCKHCGSAIDNKTKVCSGCGKKYFKGIRFNKFSLTVLILSLALVVCSALNIYQYANVQILQSEINDLEEDISANQITMAQLRDNISDLYVEKWKNSSKLDFFDEYAALVNSGSSKYHTYDCDDFDISSFWIYNVAAAEDKGYYACPECH